MTAPSIRLRPQDLDAASALARALDLPDACARVLAARGLTDPAEARAFLSPSPDALHDPFRMAGLGEAVEWLGESCRRGRRVVVFGDYDCDGVGALAILVTTLRRLGADARPFIPHRLRDGYGLRSPALRAALDEHAPDGIVTVDCGITAVEPVKEAVERGVYVVITDHHLPPEELPRGAVLVNPKLPGCPYPFKDLAGAGLAWKLAEGLLVREGERVGIGVASRRGWLASLAKIAALSTIADVVPLTGENRILTSWGLSGLKEPRSPGLTALLARSAVAAGRSPSVRQVAFQIAPRLNASGRIDHAYRAFDLLTTQDQARAEELVAELEAANDERRAIQKRLVDDVLGRLEKTFDPGRDAIVIEDGPAEAGWHRGVLGIAASRVAQQLQRPVLLLAREGEKVSGSGRTWGRTPLFARLLPVARRYATDFGGHAAALGLSMPAASLAAFREEARAVFATHRDDGEWTLELVADTTLAPAEVTPRLTAALARLEPHGQENPKALFLLRGVDWDGRGRRVGENGLRATFGAGSLRIDGVGWNLASIPQEERRGRHDLVANVALDDYTGRPGLTILHAARSAT